MTTFTPAPGGRRVQCDVCGRHGWPGGRWQDQCAAGHPHDCPCGRTFINRQALNAHQQPRRPGAAPRHHQETP